MVSIKLKYRKSSVTSKEGSLYYQLIKDRRIHRITSRYRIYSEEWDDATDTIIKPAPVDMRYTAVVNTIADTKREMDLLSNIVKSDDNLSIEEIISRFKENCPCEKGVFDYIRLQIERLRFLGRERSSETLSAALRSFMRFRGYADLSFESFNKDMMERYEAWLHSTGVTRNTSSFYMRNLRSAYNSAIEEGLTADLHPFRKVYTGIDKTAKRAITRENLRAIKALDLKKSNTLEKTRDLFLLSFYMRGMPFVDMAYLRKKDLADGYIIYRRKKTGQQLVIKWTPEMQEIVDRYTNNTKYLLPIITKEDGTERAQYQRQLSCINRNLKKIGMMAGLSRSLSSYSSRHGWATVARDMNVPLSIISQGLGHDNEKTTQIYLDSITSSIVDDANSKIISSL